MDYEEIIGQALLTGDHETGIRRATCKLAASHRMFCGCGAVHDQKKIHVIEIVHADKREETIAALCPTCYANNEAGIASVAKKATRDYVDAGQEPPVVRVATWKQFIVIPGT
jgi:hypothetical protein